MRLEHRNGSTVLFRILVRSLLASKLVLREFLLSRAALDYVIGGIESRFAKAVVHPGEMVSILAAQSCGELPDGGNYLTRFDCLTAFLLSRLPQESRA